MLWLLVRHSRAIQEEPGITDAERYLTSDGRALARRVAERLREHGVQPDLMVSSPLARAIQTADLLAEGMGYLGAIEIVPALTPGVPLRVVTAALSGLRSKVLVAVGHEPQISSLAAEHSGRRAANGMQPAEVRAVDGGKEHWVLSPTTLTLTTH